MKVYTVLKSSYCESDYSDVLKVTFSLEEAKEIVKQELETARRDYDGQSDIIFDISEDSKSFEASKVGYYAENHIAVSIKEKEFIIDGREYWKEYAKDFINNTCEGKVYCKLTNEEVEAIAEDVADNFMEDDAPNREIDQSIRYYIENNPIVVAKGKED